MRVSVFGLGYVGAVTSACLAEMGHELVGVDSNEAKRTLFGSGVSPIVEPGLTDLIRKNQKAGRLSVQGRVEDAILSTDASLVCVGTPGHRNGAVNTDTLRAVADELGRAIGRKNEEHLVIVRSTTVPGTMSEIVIPTLEKASGRTVGRGLSVAYNPEFLREGTAIDDFFTPPKTVIGADHEDAADQVASLYGGLPAPLFRVPLSAAEMTKYIDNVWHALKIGFANEIGNVCGACDVNVDEVMKVFLADTKLNISKAYLNPGFAFGGSCLPKETRALGHLGRSKDLTLPIVNSIMASNTAQIERALAKVASYGRRRVSVLGFSFKAGTDDLRESPQVELVERMIGKGYDVRLYDASVRLAALTGGNKAYIYATLPHIGSLMVDTLEEAVEHGDLIVVGNKGAEFAGLVDTLRPDQEVLDLARVDALKALGERYAGINW